MNEKPKPLTAEEEKKLRAAEWVGIDGRIWATIDELRMEYISLFGELQMHGEQNGTLRETIAEAEKDLDAMLVGAGVTIRPSEIPGTWVAYFNDYNCVTQGNSKLDAIMMLLDAARLLLQDYNPSGVCDMATLLNEKDVAQS